ncbi:MULTISPECIES: FAD-binding protein [unclassified Sphingobium]|uniref:FAD-binding protein n=1 Tax=unclassified Sphingobium TaxID=2611147 RepID=UPI00119BAE15|nr:MULTISPECIES: FAD-binding protein [unclassified Sphingobium]MBG6119971.1 3-oxosteroid 1-dehydrogenase [Sphingobium sp. JAI105]TWC99590.1 3-oxosteroid 1-dehydrogenase [Sphingobium sp. AEW010]TWD18973.1 3-oxosteroid 1-dehydrogenase [Sphingobium sp. AEW013]TWD21844.1 3-oxosteroid 1-dehydrogenase [Sphingobium sp. AEW001]
MEEPIISGHDFLIVGSGAASFVAALRARSMGLKPLIVEKRDKVGGTTGYSGGVLWVPNNPVMREAGIADSREKAARYLDALLDPPGPGSTLAKRAAFLDHGPEMVSFLLSQGMELRQAAGWSDYHDDLPGGSQRSRGLYAPLFDLTRLGEWGERLSVHEKYKLPTNSTDLAKLVLAKRTWRGRMTAMRVGARMLHEKLTGSRRRGLGAALQGRLLDLALKAGIPIMMETRLTALDIQDGQVAGIVAEQGGRTIRIASRHGVLLNAGGFARNPEMRARHQPKPTPRWTNANPADTGDALNAAIAIGAATCGMDLSWYAPTSTMPDGSLPPGAQLPFMHHIDLAKPHIIMVDRTGRRFSNESGSYHENGKAMYRAGAVPCFGIMDARHRSRYPWGFAMPGITPAAWLESGYMKRADTLAELAIMLGIDPDGLAATVERFNRFAQTGVDEDFRRGARAFDRYHGDPTCRPNPCLGAIEQGPFYGVTMFPGDLGTNGGLISDEHGRVLKEGGDVIEGLYAAGNMTRSVMATSYPGPGGTIGPAMVFGDLAAIHAAGRASSRDMEAVR